MINHSEIEDLQAIHLSSKCKEQWDRTAYTWSEGFRTETEWRELEKKLQGFRIESLSLGLIFLNPLLETMRDLEDRWNQLLFICPSITWKVDVCVFQQHELVVAAEPEHMCGYWMNIGGHFNKLGAEDGDGGAWSGGLNPLNSYNYLSLRRCLKV